MGYQIWDKKSDIFTPSGHKFTASEWEERYPWVKIPGVKMIITSGIINGGVALEFQSTIERYTNMGVDFTSCSTDGEMLTAIEEFELHPPGYDQPTVEERTAAALEAQVLLALPAEEETANTATVMMARTLSLDAETAHSPSFERVKGNYTRGLWSAALVNMAASKGQITQAEASEILNS